MMAFVTTFLARIVGSQLVCAGTRARVADAQGASGAVSRSTDVRGGIRPNFVHGIPPKAARTDRPQRSSVADTVAGAGLDGVGWRRGRSISTAALAECYQLDATWSNPALQREIRIKSQLLCQLSYAPFVRLFPGTSADASAEHRQSRLMSQLGKLRVRKSTHLPAFGRP